MIFRIDPWGQKEVLNYLLNTADEKLKNDVKLLQKDLQLTDNQLKQLKELGIREHQTIWQKEKQRNDSTSFSDELTQVFTDTDSKTKEILGEKYETFREWIRNWWKDEMEYRTNWLKKKTEEGPPGTAIGIESSIDRRLVFATQYAANTSYEVALPDKYVKFANLGWWNEIPSPRLPYYNNPPYTVNLYRESNNKSVLNVKVKEVGPQNEDDNYWDAADDANERRFFKDLDLGEPEVEAAYNYGYNGGKDQFGDPVPNPAGVDLSFDVATDLGLQYLENDWIWVNYSDLP